MRIFITGVAGFLGSHLADAFLAEGHEVHGVDNFLGGYRDNLPDGVHFYEGDCNDVELMRACLKDVDVVYHCAATAYEGLSVFSPHVVTQNIVTATTGVLAAACHRKVRRFVFCSSMARYGTNDVPFQETMAPRPQDPYGIGKVCAEQMVRNLCETHRIEWVIAVPHNIVGPRQKYDDPYRNVASIFANLMLQNRQPYLYGDGQQKRCFSFIADDVRPLMQMATWPTVVGEVVNIGPDDEFVTVYDLGAKIARLVGVPYAPLYTTGRPREVRLANCSANKARQLLGYEPRVSLEEGLTELIAYIKKRGVREFQYHLPLEIVNEQTPETWAKRLF